MVTVLGVYPDRRDADRVRQKLEQSGLEMGKIALFTREDMGRVERLLSSITTAQPQTRTGLLIGAIIGGLAGFLGGMGVYPMIGSELPSLVFGLFGMLPFAVLGGYLGSLYGTRGATQDKINIKERLWNDDAVLIVAQAELGEEQSVAAAMRAADGEFVASRELTVDEIESLLR